MTVGSNDDESDAVRLDDGAGTLRLREVEKSAVISRRGVLWRAGLATAAGAAALTALDERRAEAASGGSFILGQSNDAASTSSLKVTNGTTVGLSYLMSLDGSAGVTQSTLQISGPSTGTGVFGSSSSGTGLYGSSSSGTGLAGSSTSGAGVTGASGTGSGVAGSSTSGTGVSATSSGGTALRVSGKTHFSRSGGAIVARGSRTKRVDVGGMTTSSLVLATLQVSVSGVYIAGAVPASGHFTLYLNKAAPSNMKFAWFVLAG